MLKLKYLAMSFLIISFFSLNYVYSQDVTLSSNFFNGKEITEKDNKELLKIKNIVEKQIKNSLLKLNNNKVNSINLWELFLIEINKNLDTLKNKNN